MEVLHEVKVWRINLYIERMCVSRLVYKFVFNLLNGRWFDKHVACLFYFVFSLVLNDLFKLERPVKSLFFVSLYCQYNITRAAIIDLRSEL